MRYASPTRRTALGGLERPSANAEQTGARIQIDTQHIRDLACQFRAADFAGQVVFEWRPKSKRKLVADGLIGWCDVVNVGCDEVGG